MKRIIRIGFLFALIFVMCSCGKSVKEKWQEQYDLGQKYLLEEDYEAAIVAFTAAIEIESSDIRTYTGLVMAYIGLEDYESAVTMADGGLAVLTVENTEQQEEAVDDFVSVSREAYQTVEDVGAQANFWGLLLDYYADAEVRQQICEDGSTALYNLGQKYLETEDYDTAIAAFGESLVLNPGNVDVYVERGGAYILSGETEENLTLALADYEAALRLDDTVVEAYLGIADVYIRRGDYDSALEILQEGLEKTDYNEEIAAKIEEIESGTVVDSAGNIRRQSSYDGDGALIWYHEFTYNADGTQASVTSYDVVGNQTGHVDMEYGDDGKKTRGLLD